MAAKTISLLDLRRHVRALDVLIHDAWMSKDHPAQISYADVRKHVSSMAVMVAEDGPSAKQSPHASEGNKPPAAADNDKTDAAKRAALQRAAADKQPAFDISSLYIRN